MALTEEELKAIRERSSPFSASDVTKPTQELPPGAGLYATPGEKAAAVGLGVAQGAVQGAPVAAGAITGLRLGAIAAPAFGPVAPAVPVVGTLLGAGAGLLAGDALNTLLLEDYAAAQRKDVAPFREGGKTFGATIAFAPAAFGLPVMTGNRVAQFISLMGEGARRSPGIHMAGEALAGTAAGIAGGTVYSIDPTATGARLGAEVTAGLLTPTRILLNGVTTAKNALSGVKKQVGVENKAAGYLQKLLDDYGEDIPALVRELQRPLPGSVPEPTAAQKSGRMVLAELETALGNMHVKFGADTEAQGREALQAYTLLIDRLRKSGDPSALTAAAQLRSDLFDQMIAGRLATADANAARRVMRISRDTPQARAEIGEIVKAETSFALQNAREVEKMLWDEALAQVTAPVKKTVTRTVARPAQTPAERFAEASGRPPMASWKETTVEAPKLAASNAYAAFITRAAQIGNAVYDTAIPKAIRDIAQDLGANKNTVLTYKYKVAARGGLRDLSDENRVTVAFADSSNKPREVDVGELINYRSNLLAMARDSAARGEVSDASWYGTMADSILQDLSQLKSPAFDSARDFSRSLNDTFTRTFANTASVQGARTAAGGERVPAEILVSRAFGRNADLTAQRMTEIEDGVRFMRTQYDEAVAKFGVDSDQAKMMRPLAELANESVVSIQDAQSRVLRLMAAKTIDPLTNRVNPRALQSFVNENKAMLDKFGITRDLTDAVTAENTLRLIANQNSKLNTTLRNQTMFAQVLNAGEKPTIAVTQVLNGSSPVLGMNHLVKLARTGGAGAEDGLKSTVLDYAFTKAGGVDNFNAQAFRDALFKPLGKNKPSVIGLLQQHNLMTRQEIVNINELVKPMIRIEDAIANKQSLDEVLRGADAVTEFALRVIGSKIGSTVAPKGPGSLITASAGSKVVRQIFDKMPTLSMRAMLEQAAQDPQLMALLLQKNVPPSGAFQHAKELAARLATSGVLPASVLNTISEENVFGFREPPRPTAADMLKRLPSAPPVNGVPSLPATPPKGSAPGAAGPGRQSSLGSGMYQALFPNDDIAAMMGMRAPGG